VHPWSGARPADTFDADIAKVSAIAPGSRATLPTYAFALSPDARAELSLRGTITPDDLELLRDHIELTIKALARKAKAVEQ